MAEIALEGMKRAILSSIQARQKLPPALTNC
jgi:hypothetical protein